MIRFYSKQSGNWLDQWTHPALRGYGQEQTVAETNEETIQRQFDTIAGYEELVEIQRRTIKTNLYIGLGIGGAAGLAIGLLVGKAMRRK